MANTVDETAGGLYSSVMEEVMVRIHSLMTLVQNPMSLKPVFIREYGYLQLRISCELIAIGCLICHGDIKAAQTKRIQKAYVPAEILNQLQALHSDFYPVPVDLQKVPDGWNLAEYTGDYLRKDELVGLWNKCGDHLHKGSLRTMLKSKSNIRTEVSLDEMISYAQKLINLVNNHRISRKGNNYHFLTTMNIDGWGSRTTTISVNVAIAETIIADK